MSVHTLNIEANAPLRVLTSDLPQRLREINDARTALAKAGYRVIRQDVRQGSGQPPLLTLHSGSTELRNVSNYVRSVSGTVVARLYGVDVTWPELQS